MAKKRANRVVITVSPNRQDGGWVVKQQGRKSPVSAHRLKTAAVKKGKRLAKKAPAGQIRIMRQDGRLQAQHRYSAAKPRSRSRSKR